jgi:DNA-binding beta-propeller fold protein YncE
MRLAGRFALALVLLALGATAWAQAPAATQSFKLPGDGPWDYVTFDSANRRVFIGRYNGVQVVDADTGKLRTTIGARTGDHGATIAADLHRLFTSDAAARQLGIYDLATLKAQTPVKLGGEPDGMVYDPASHRVLAFLPHSHEVVAVDARTLHVAGRLDVGGEAEAGVADAHGSVFVTLRDLGAVLRLDTATLRVKARWAAGCPRPSPIAMDLAADRLFVACRDRRLIVLDAANGRTVAQAPIGDGTDGLAFDAPRHLVVASNGGGSITLVQSQAADRYARIGDLATAKGARTMALDAAGGRVFTVTADIARVEPPTPTRPYPRLIPKIGSFRLIIVRLPG